MDKNKIKVALLGLGRIGQMHAKNLIENREFKLKYIFDLNKDLLKKISNKYNVTSINKPDLAFNDKDIDCIFIASSTPTHLKFIEQGIKKNKIIFCEKPLDLNIKSSGGIFKDMMIHDFDLARYYLGKDEFQSIFAMGSNLSDKRFNKINDYELATTILKSKKGVQCIITNSRHCSFGYDQRVELFGNKGMLVSDNKRNDEINYFSKSSTNSKSPLLHFFIERYSEAFKLQLFDLAKFCRKNTKPRAVFEDGRKSIILAEGAMNSIKSKRFEKLIY